MSDCAQHTSPDATPESENTIVQIEDEVNSIEVLSFAGDWQKRAARLCESLDHNKISSALARELRLVVTTKDGRQETELRYRYPGKAASIKHSFRVEGCVAHDLVIGEVGYEYLNRARRGSFPTFGPKKNKSMLYISPRASSGHLIR